MRHIVLIVGLLAAVSAQAAVSPPFIPHSSSAPVVRVDLWQTHDATDPGEPLTGLDNTSSGLAISCIASPQSTWTDYTAGGSTIEAITTIGTYAAPTASNVRFEEVESEGVYELQFETSLFNVSGSNSVTCKISGATNLATRTFTMYQLSPEIDTNGRVASNVEAVSGDATAADNIEAFFDGTGYNASNSEVGTVATLTGHTAQTGDSFARLGAPTGASISADIAAAQTTLDALNDLGAADVRTALGMASADLDTQLDAIVADTNELQTDWANGGRLELRFDGIEGSTFSSSTDSLEAIRDRGDSAWTTGGGGSLTVADIWSYECEPENTPAIQCDDAIAYILAEAVGEGASPSSGTTWDLNTPDGAINRIDITYGSDSGDRTISLTAPSR